MSVRWGLLGAGWVAKTGFVPALNAAHNATLQGVASRDPARSSALAPKTVHLSYDELLADPEIDAVYISLPNHLHAEWSVKALAAGKHVLCEKPLTRTAHEASIMMSAATTHDRLLVEALWFRWHPRFARIVELIQRGDIGKVTSIDSAFTFPATFEENYRLSPDMGGGSLLDVGPYQAHLWAAIIDKEARFSSDFIERNIGPTGIDLTTQWQGSFSNGCQVSALTSFEKPEEQRFLITGDSASIQCLDTQAFTSWNSPSSIKVGDHEEEFAPVDPFRLMIENVGARISGRESWLPSMRESLMVMEIFDQLRSN
jgi:predicted dehydrogenase